MRGSWAGAMGHTQWMPEVWLHVGIDYDGDGKFAIRQPRRCAARPPKYLVDRGKYGAETLGMRCAPKERRLCRDGRAPARCAPTASKFPQSDASAQLWTPELGGP